MGSVRDLYDIAHAENLWMLINTDCIHGHMFRHKGGSEPETPSSPADQVLPHPGDLTPNGCGNDSGPPLAGSERRSAGSVFLPVSVSDGATGLAVAENADRPGSICPSHSGKGGDRRSFCPGPLPPHRESCHL